jgi:hypothetical protein
LQPNGGGSLKTPTLKFSENWVLVIVSRASACVFRTTNPLKKYICSWCGNHIDSAYNNEKQDSNKQLHLKPTLFYDKFIQSGHISHGYDRAHLKVIYRLLSETPISLFCILSYLHRHCFLLPLRPLPVLTQHLRVNYISDFC